HVGDLALRVDALHRRRDRKEWKKRGQREKQEGEDRFHAAHYASLAGTSAKAASQASAEASDGDRQSPRGASEPPQPTFGAVGATLRLNWLRMNLSRNVFSHLRMTGSRYLPFQACQARNATLAGA